MPNDSNKLFFLVRTGNLFTLQGYTNEIESARQNFSQEIRRWKLCFTSIISYSVYERSFECHNDRQEVFRPRMIQMAMTVMSGMAALSLTEVEIYGYEDFSGGTVFTYL